MQVVVSGWALPCQGVHVGNALVRETMRLQDVRGRRVMVGICVAASKSCVGG